MKFRTILVVILLANISFAQKPKTPIQLDRPDQTECPFITPENYLQAENGFNYENGDSNIKTLVLPTILWKYGINENLELRLITELNSIINNEKFNTGFIPVTFGFKVNLLEENGIIPLTSFIGHITTAKLGSSNFATTFIAPSFRFTMQHSISPKVSLAYNLGAEWNGENARQTYIYTLTSGISLGDKTGCYFEVYGFLPQDFKSDHRFDSGFTYLVNNDFILDLSGGFKFDNLNINYISLGVSYRFNTKKVIKNKV